MHISSYPGLASTESYQSKLVLELPFIEDRAKGTRWVTETLDPPFANVPKTI